MTAYREGDEKSLLERRLEEAELRIKTRDLTIKKLSEMTEKLKGELKKEKESKSVKERGAMIFARTMALALPLPVLLGYAYDKAPTHVWNGLVTAGCSAIVLLLIIALGKAGVPP